MSDSSTPTTDRQQFCPKCPYAMIHSSWVPGNNAAASDEGNWFCTKCGAALTVLDGKTYAPEEVRQLAIVGLRSYAWKKGRIDDRYENENRWISAVSALEDFRAAAVPAEAP